MDDKDMETPSKVDATKSEADLVFDENITIEDLMNSSVFSVLARCLLENDHTTLQFKAAFIVTNLICGKPDKPDKAIIVRLLFQLLSSFALDEHEEDILALVDFICDTPELRRYIIDNKCVDPILALITVDRPTSWLRIAIRLINNLCCHELEIRTEGAPKLIPLLSHTNTEIQKCALNTIIKSSGYQFKTLVANHNILSYFPGLLSHSNDDIRTEAFQFLLDISQYLQRAILCNDLLSYIFEDLRKDESKTQILAAQVIGRLTMCYDRSFISRLISRVSIPPLCDSLTSNNVEVVKVSLDSLYNIYESECIDVKEIGALIKEYGGFEKIINLQNHENGEILEIAHTIMILIYTDKEALLKKFMDDLKL